MTKQRWESWNHFKSWKTIINRPSFVFIGFLSGLSSCLSLVSTWAAVIPLQVCLCQVCLPESWSDRDPTGQGVWPGDRWPRRWRSTTPKFWRHMTGGWPLARKPALSTLKGFAVCLTDVASWAAMRRMFLSRELRSCWVMCVALRVCVSVCHFS